VAPTPPATRAVVIMSEVLTARLEIKLVSPRQPFEAAGKLSVSLPDAPADLELTIDGAAPVWTHRGPALPTDFVQPSLVRFDENGARLVDLTAALAALTGDPGDQSEVELELTLSSAVPGVLTIGEQPAELDVAHLHRVELGPNGRRRIELAEEGETIIPFALPSWMSTLESASVIVAADLGDERVIPPIGPPFSATAELLLDRHRAIAVRIPAGTGLIELHAIRLPIASERGAEVKVLLLESLELPLSPLPAELAPIEISATEPTWTTFALEDPLALDEAALPWVLVIAGRGEAVLPLAEHADAPETRLGPPEGPFRELPLALRTGTFAAPIRVSGIADEDHPIAPIVVDAGGAAVAVTPAPDGTPAEVAAATGQLRIISHVAGAIDLRELILTGQRNS
jgi:hypothetical protein